MKNIGAKCAYVCVQQIKKRCEDVKPCAIYSFRLSGVWCTYKEAKLWNIAHCQYKLFWYKYEFSMCQHNQL